VVHCWHVAMYHRDEEDGSPARAAVAAWVWKQVKRR
jgi:hypothetical protein